MCRWITAGLVGLVMMFTSTAKGEEPFSTEQKGEIEEIIQEYLVTNPEVIYEAIQLLRQRQEETAAARAEEALEHNQHALTQDPNSPVGGNPDGDVTIVEFFDYRCGFCKRAHPTISAFIEQDGNIRLVYKEFPILGPDSTLAARAALAAREQGKYHAFHDLLMAERNINQTTIRANAETAGLNWDQLAADMESEFVTAHIEDSMQLAQSLGINGTPAFVIGNRLVPGAVEISTLEDIVREIREQG